MTQSDIGIVEKARESWSRILNMDGGGPQATAAGLWASMYAAPLLNAARTPDPIITEMVEALTPSAETKAAYMGEFSFTVEDTDDEWGLPITRRIDVPWTTIKEIMAAIRTRAKVRSK